MHRSLHSSVYFIGGRLASVLAIIMMLNCILDVEGKAYVDIANSDHAWQYLARFSYCAARGIDVGTFEYRVSNFAPNTQLILYDDRHNDWADIYTGKYSCIEKVHMATPHNVFNLSARASALITINTTTVNWYWVALAQCDSNYGVSADYYLNFRNVGHAKWSCEDREVRDLYISYAILFLLLAIVQGINIYGAKKCDRYDLLSKLVFGAAVVQLLAAGVQIGYYQLERNSNNQFYFVKLIGDVFDTCVELVLITIALLISFGWAINGMFDPLLAVVGGESAHRSRFGANWQSCMAEIFGVSRARHLVVLGSLGMSAFLYCVLFIVEAATHNDALVYFDYQNAAGILLLILRIVLAVWIAYNFVQCWHVNPNMTARKFHLVFTIGSVAWLIIPGIGALIVGTSVVREERELVMCAILETLNFVTIAALIGATWYQWSQLWFQFAQVPSYFSDTVPTQSYGSIAAPIVPEATFMDSQQSQDEL